MMFISCSIPVWQRYVSVFSDYLPLDLLDAGVTTAAWAVVVHPR